MGRGQKKKGQQKFVGKQVEELFKQAEKNLSKADQYVKKARRLAMKVEMPLPRLLKKRFCRYCYSYFTPTNVRTRIKDKTLIQYCLSCKKYNKLKFE